MDREQEWVPEDWERLGRAFAAARLDKGFTQQQVADSLGVSRAPVQAVERGRQSNGTNFTKVTRTMRDYAALVGWTVNSPARILDGEGPEQDTRPVPEAPAAEPQSDLPPSVTRELRKGRTLDHTVVHLSGEDDDDDVRLVVILKGAEDMSEEEIDRRYEQWRRARRQLQAIPGESDTPEEP